MESATQLLSVERNGTNDGTEEPQPSADAIPPSKKLPRVQSLDALRGLTICLMILVNNQTEGSFSFLEHSKWNGLTLPDLVFPSFLFCMGAAMGLTMKHVQRRTPLERRAMWHRVLVRFGKLLGIGLLLATHFFLGSGLNLHEYRLPGVLQRIAVCYLVVSTILLLVPETWVPYPTHVHAAPLNNASTLALDGRSSLLNVWWLAVWQWCVVLGLLILYLVLLLGIDVPGCGHGHIGPTCNMAQYLDVKIFTPHHMYKYPTCMDMGCAPFDPEGFLGTLTSCVSTFLGVHFGRVLTLYMDKKIRLQQWTGFSIVLVVLGLILHFSCLPFNKNLWSPSYVLFMAGADGLVLVVLYILIDVLGHALLVKPLIAVGMNPIALYVGSDVLVIIMIYLHHGTRSMLYYYLHYVFETWLPLAWASLFYSMTHVALWVSVGWRMFRKGIIIKL